MLGKGGRKQRRDTKLEENYNERREVRRGDRGRGRRGGKRREEEEDGGEK